VYFPELLAPLLRSLLHLSSPPFVSKNSPSERWPKVIISYKIRSLPKEMSFWSAFGLWFAFEPVLIRNTVSSSEQSVDDPDMEGTNIWSWFGSGGDDDTFIFVARRRPDSLVWNVPLDDVELLAGVGAHGDLSRKSDDTFETLLLMALSSE
jgi:hypothetical protein